MELDKVKEVREVSGSLEANSLLKKRMDTPRCEGS